MIVEINSSQVSPRKGKQDEIRNPMLNSMKVDAQDVFRKSIISLAEVTEQAMNQKQVKTVLFTQEAPMKRNSMLTSLTKNKKNVQVNFQLPESGTKEEDYLVQKQKLIQELDILERIDRQNPLNQKYVQLQKKNSFRKKTQGVKKMIATNEMKKQILKKQRDEQEERDDAYQESQDNFRAVTRLKSLDQNDLARIFDEQVENSTDKEKSLSTFRRTNIKRNLHREKIGIHIPKRDGTFLRQDMKDLDRGTPNNLIEFTPQDFQYLDKTKLKQLKDAELDLKQVKQVENRESLILNQELKVKWQRVKRKIRMIGKMKMVFDEVKLYGTSFKVETSEKRNEVIAHFENLLQSRMIIMEDPNKLKQKAWLLHPDSIIKQYWSFVLFFLLFYTAFITPLRITFFEDDTSLSWTINDYFIDALFVIDITITFNSAFYTELHELIYSRRLVTINYFKTWFLLDILAIFPFDLVMIHTQTSTTNYNYFQLSRIPRTYRLVRMARIFYMLKKISHNKLVDKFQEYFQINSGIRRVLIFFLTVIVCVHIMGCFWYYAAKIENFETDTWATSLGYHPSEKFALYIASIYWSVSTIATVGFGDIRGYNDLERVICCFWMIVGAGFYSFTVGSLSSILSQQDTKDAHLQNKITITDEFCKETNLTTETRGKIRKALEYSAMKSIFSKKQRDEFLKEIPLDLKFRVSEAMYENLKAKVAFFKDKESLFIANFVTILQPSHVSLGEIIYQKGEHPSLGSISQYILVYFLVSGRVNMVIGMHQITFKTYVQGSYFGEVEIFDASPRLHTTRAEIECDMLTISQVDFLNILKLFPDYYQEVRSTSFEKMRRENEAIRKMQKIANLSFKSKFWQKQRTQNIYQTVKERQQIHMEVFSSSNESDAKDLIEIPSQGSINSKSQRSIYSRRSQQSKKTYENFKKKLAGKNTELLPSDYRHSLIPNIESLDGLHGDALQNNENQNILYAQSFNIPRHARSHTQNFIQIKVSEFHQDPFSEVQLSPDSLTSIQPKNQNPMEDQEEPEYLTYTERYLKIPKVKIEHLQEQQFLTTHLERQQSLTTIQSKEAEEEQSVLETKDQSMLETTDQKMNQFKEILTTHLKENDTKMDKLNSQFDRILEKLQKALKREVMIKESTKLNLVSQRSQNKEYTLQNVFVKRLSITQEPSHQQTQTEESDFNQKQYQQQLNQIVTKQTKVDFIQLEEQDQKTKSKLKHFNLSKMKPNIGKTLTQITLDSTNQNEGLINDGEDLDLSL